MKRPERPVRYSVSKEEVLAVFGWVSSQIKDFGYVDVNEAWRLLSPPVIYEPADYVAKATVLPVLRRVRAVVLPNGWSETHLDELIKELEGE